ncbi:hypothetical protein BBJ28_00023424, partial [Nothophytophthora sp. Chile5]
ANPCLGVKKRGFRAVAKRLAMIDEQLEHAAVQPESERILVLTQKPVNDEQISPDEEALMKQLFIMVRGAQDFKKKKQVYYLVYDFAACVCPAIAPKTRGFLMRRWDRLKKAQNRIVVSTMSATSAGISNQIPAESIAAPDKKRTSTDHEAASTNVVEDRANCEAVNDSVSEPGGGPTDSELDNGVGRAAETSHGDVQTLVTSFESAEPSSRPGIAWPITFAGLPDMSVLAKAELQSSLNGPFCAGVAPEFVLAPAHAALNLDEVDLREMAKRVKIETVLKQYDVQAAASETDQLEQQEIILDIEMLLDESMALLTELDDDEDGESPMAGSFAFSSEGGAFELLEKMDGDELKEFFELALDEVLQSVEAALQEMSPDAAQGVRTTARQMKAMKDYSSYTFQRLDEAKRASIRRKFANHRLVELQQTFERLVIARTAQDRQLAYETSIFLFQLAQEEAVAAAVAEKEAEAEPTDSDTATAVTDATE